MEQSPQGLRVALFSFQQRRSEQCRMQLRVCSFLDILLSCYLVIIVEVLLSASLVVWVFRFGIRCSLRVWYGYGLVMGISLVIIHGVVSRNLVLA